MSTQSKPLFKEDFDYIEADQEVIIPEEIQKSYQANSQYQKRVEFLRSQMEKETAQSPQPSFDTFISPELSHKDSYYDQNKDSIIITKPTFNPQNGEIIPTKKKKFKKRYWIAGLVLLFALLIGVGGGNSNSIQDAQAGSKNEFSLEQKRIEELKAQQKSEGDAKLAERESKKEEVAKLKAEKVKIQAEKEAEEARIAEEKRIEEARITQEEMEKKLKKILQRTKPYSKILYKATPLHQHSTLHQLNKRYDFC